MRLRSAASHTQALRMTWPQGAVERAASSAAPCKDVAIRSASPCARKRIKAAAALHRTAGSYNERIRRRFAITARIAIAPARHERATARTAYNLHAQHTSLTITSTSSVRPRVARNTRLCLRAPGTSQHQLRMRRMRDSAFHNAAAARA